MSNERVQSATTNHQETTVPFTAGDGMECNLIHVQGEKPSTRGGLYWFMAPESAPIFLELR